MKLRIATANLWRGAAEPEALSRFVETVHPDVFCVQELAPEQAEAIADVLPHGHLAPDSRGFDGTGIALRHPAQMQRLATGERDGWVARLAGWPGQERPLEVVNVHILAPHARPLPRSFPVRRRQLDAVLRHVGRAPGSPLVLCGDLNATPLWPVYRRLASPLMDLASAGARRMGTRPGRTWGPWSGSPRLLRIDHVLGRGVTSLAAHVVDVDGSDHSAVVVEIEV